MLDTAVSSSSPPSSVDDTETRDGSGLSEEEFNRVYERHAAEILRYSIRCVGRREIAEELASEAFLRLYKHRDRVDSTTAVAWLVSVVKNLSTDYWRRARIERQCVSATSELQTLPELGTFLLDHPSLKPEHRVCLTLRYSHGMDRGEIAAYTGMTDNQVKSCLQYGLQLLRTALQAKTG